MPKKIKSLKISICAALILLGGVVEDLPVTRERRMKMCARRALLCHSKA